MCVCVYGTTDSVSQSTAGRSTTVHTGLPANDVHSNQHQGSNQQDTTPTYCHNMLARIWGLYLGT